MEHEFGHTVIWDDELEIVRAIGVGAIDEGTAIWFKECTQRLAAEHEGQLDWLLDMREVTKTTAKARRITAEAVGHPSIGKYAIFGASTFMSTISKYVIGAAGLKNYKFFSNEDEALAWLKDE